MCALINHVSKNQTPQGERAPDAKSWQSLLDEFRALGGVAENIALRPSGTGRGLFPENPDQPVRLTVPANLLIRPREIALYGDRIGLHDGAGTEQRPKAFFERYQAEFSWGGGRQEQGAALLDLFDSLPPELRNRLTKDFGMEAVIEGERGERMLRCFLRSRGIRRRGEVFLAPIFDCMNRGSEGLYPKFGPKGSVQLEGRSHGEILLAYEQYDSLGIFIMHGIALPREHAFSLPMRTKAGPFELFIGRDLTASAQRPGFRAPQMRTESDVLRLSYLTVGDAGFPRMPRGIFYALMRDARAGGAEEIFDRILFANRTKFLSLLALLDPLRGELVSRLRSMVHFQLAALAECLGAREL